MIVLAFDPGSIEAGYAVLKKDSDISLITYGPISIPRSLDLGKRLKTTYKYVKDLIRVYQPNAIACEDQFSGKNVKTLMTLREITAILRLVSSEEGLPFYLYHPNTVKKQSVGDGKASKDKVMTEIKERFSIKETISNDISDAIAVGITFFNKADE